VAACTFQWEWGGRAVKVAYEKLGTGRPVLLLPAFSTVSSREEMRPLAEHLASRGCGCLLVDWPGFGGSMRGQLGYGPPLYYHFLADFATAVVPKGAAVVAADTLPAMRSCWRVIGRVCGRTQCCWRPPGGDRSRPRWVSIRELTRGLGDLSPHR
jgi:hypothetical protein